MNIIISGCGNVGYHLARTLMKEGHNVTVIDADPEVCQRVSRQLDVLCLQGSGMDLDVLQEAGATQAYLFINRAEIGIAAQPRSEAVLIAQSRRAGGPGACPDS